MNPPPSQGGGNAGGAGASNPSGSNGQSGSKSSDGKTKAGGKSSQGGSSKSKASQGGLPHTGVAGGDPSGILTGLLGLALIALAAFRRWSK